LEDQRTEKDQLQRQLDEMLDDAEELREQSNKMSEELTELRVGCSSLKCFERLSYA
jgi:uncharacterized coiled-coil DUF342 family protein